MRKWIILVVVVAVLFGVCVIAVRNLNSYLNANKDWIAQRVESLLGREVQFGEIGVSLAGGLGVRVSNLRVADDPGYSDGALVRADSALVRVRVLPALFGRYEVSRVVLEGPAVTIVRTADGLNVSTLGGGAEAEPTEQGAETAKFVVAFMDIDNGQILYVDKTTTPPSEIRIDQLDFVASDVRLDAPISFELDAAVLGSRSQNARVTGSVGPVDPSGGSPMPLQIALKVAPISTDDLARIEPVAGALPVGLHTSGPVSMEAAVTGTVADATAHVRLDGTAADVELGEAMRKPKGVPLSADVDARYTGTAVEIAQATLAFHKARAKAAGSLSLGESTAYDVRLRSDPVPLAGWDEVLPSLAGLVLGGRLEADVRAHASGTGGAPALDGVISIDDASARKQGTPAIEKLTTKVRLAGDKVTIEPANFLLGGSPATLTAEVEDLEKQAIVLTLTSPALRPASLGFAAEGSADDEVLRDLRVDANVQMAAPDMKVRAKAVSRGGRLHGADYSDLSADLRYENQRAVLNPITWKAFGGTVRGEGIYDMRDAARPSFNFESQLQGVRIGDLLATFAGAGEKLVGGTLDANVSLAGSGDQWKAIEPSLVGGGRLGLRDGMLKDFNLVDGVLRKMTGVPGLSDLLSPELAQKYPRLFSSKDTYFDALEGAFSIAEGRLVSDDLMLRAKDYAARGKGGIGFDRSLDVNATLDLSQALTDDLVARVGVAKHLADRSGRIQIPFKLGGTIPSVKPQPDMSFVTHAVQRAAVEGVVEGILKSGRKRETQEEPAANGKESKAAEKETEGAAKKGKEDQIRRGIEGLLGR